MIIGGYLTLHQLAAFTLASWKVYFTVGFFFVLTYAAHKSMSSAIDERPALFANRFMLSIILKLVLGFVLFLVIGLTSHKAEIIPYGVCFLVSYLGFTIFGSQQAMKLKDGREKRQEENPKS